MATQSTALKAIQANLASEDWYSAHQKARTTAARLLTTRKPTGTPVPYAEDKKAQEAASVLWETSRSLLEKGQVGSGVDLGVYLCEVWKSKEVACGDAERAQILQLIALTGPAGAWRKTLTDAVFSWSSKTGSGAAGDTAIHGYLGEVLYKEQNYDLASHHLLVCPTQDAARTLAEVMFAWSKLDKEGKTGVGRYAARGALSYLESSSILPARTFLSHFLSLTLTLYPDLLLVRFPHPPPTTPLSKLPTTEPDELFITKLASLNFLQLAVKTAQVGAGETVEKFKGADGTMKEQKGKGRLAWQSLLSRYEKELGWLKLPEVKESTQDLGTIYFGIKPPRQGNNMMDLLGSMFGGGGGGGGGPTPAIGAR